MNAFRLFLFLAFSMIVFMSCSKDDDDNDVDQIEILLNEVRAETSAFVDYESAKAAGWDTALSDCVQHPTEGGMGVHYGRMEYFDGRVNHLQPQVLLYLPHDNGDMEFLGVEYIVPFAIVPDTAMPPMLFDQHFHANHQLEFWALHVWTQKENPSGVFNDWNPDVHCD